MTSKTGIGGSTNTASYLLAYCIVNMIIRQDEKVIGRMNRARLMWSIIKSNDTFRNAPDAQHTQYKEELNSAFNSMRGEYQTEMDTDPGYYIFRVKFELQLDDTIDRMFEIIDKYGLVTQSQLMEIEGEDYSKNFTRED